MTVSAVPFCGEGVALPERGNLVKARYWGVGVMRSPINIGRGLGRGLLLLVTVVAALSFGVARASAATNLLTNGSFETGDFTGWTATSTETACGLDGDPWTVLASPSSSWCFSGFDPSWPTSISAVDGSFFADATWDGDGSGDPELSQTVTIPAATTDTLAWSDNTSWDLNFGATKDRVEYVDVLSGDGTTVLQSSTIQTLAPSTIGATGWVSHSLDLSAYAGQTVEIRFRLTVPETFTGPANFALDGVTLDSTSTSGGYAGTPGQANCVGKSVSALSIEFNGNLSAAAQALGFASVQALQQDIKHFCST